MKEIDIYTSKYFFILKNFQTTKFKILVFCFYLPRHFWDPFKLIVKVVLPRIIFCFQKKKLIIIILIIFV